MIDGSFIKFNSKFCNIIFSNFPVLLVLSWKTKESPLEVKTKGICKIFEYSIACCIPDPTACLLSFASIIAIGTLGL